MTSDIAKALTLVAEWRSVPGFEGLYEVSDLGEVRSIRRQRVMRHCIDKYRYHAIDLFDRESRRQRWRINVLVLTVFAGPRPKDHHGSHLDGNRENNRLSNLRWETAQQNNARQHEHGTILLGEEKPTAKLTADLVRLARERVKAGEFFSKIARDFGVSRHAITRAVKREQWRHVP